MLRSVGLRRVPRETHSMALVHSTRLVCLPDSNHNVYDDDRSIYGHPISIQLQTYQDQEENPCGNICQMVVELRGSFFRLWSSIQR